MSQYDDIASRARLREGWSRVQAGSAMAGADGVSPRMFELRLERELGMLHQELHSRTYQAGALLRFAIPKPNGKQRILAVPPVRDRVAQAAALAVLQPLLEDELEAASFAYRPGRSYRDAIRRLRRLRDAGYRWVVDADIEAFFDRVDHDLLIERLGELVPEPDVQALVRQWIAADAVQDGQTYRRTEGLPQGAIISPLLANLYLDELDEAVLEAGFQLVRYADDFLVLCRSEPEAEKALQLTDELLGRLELRLNEEKTRVTSFDEGFRFLGSLFVRSLVLPSKNRTMEAVPQSASAGVLVDGPAAQVDVAGAEAAGGDVATDGEALAEVAKRSEAGTREEDAGAVLRGRAGLPVPRRAQLEHTALGRAFLRALDAEGVPLRDFVAALAEPEASVRAEVRVGSGAGERAPLAAALAYSEEDDPDPEAPVVLRPGTAPFMRTLYIQEQGAWLRINRGRFVVTVGREPRKELLVVPALQVDQIVLFGTCLVTPAALRYCLRHAIPVTLLSTRGRYYGQVESVLARDVSRQRLQFLHALDTGFRLALARRLVTAKLHNTRSLVRRYARRSQDGALQAAARELGRLLRLLPQAQTLDQVRGYEGRGSAVYFGVFGRLLARSDFTFSGRTRRPPTDPVNAMLSLGYTLLFDNLYALVRMHRMNPYVGFLHDERAGHPALVSDLIEEFRFVIDRMVLGLSNRQRLTPGDFTYPEPDAPAQGCFLTEAGRKAFIRAFEQAMHREVKHPTTGVTTTYRRCLDLQVRAFARHLDGTEPYVPFSVY